MPKIKEVLDTIAKYDLTNIIEYRSPVTHNTIPELLNNSHALILYSFDETFSCITAEAQCCGIPTIVPNRGGPAEICNYSNAIICNPLDTGSLADAIHSMIENYSKFNTDEIAKAASARYDYSVVASQIDSIYDAVISS
jgi:L-malate glycosyltransferase